MAIQLFVSLIEFKLTTLAGFVLVPFGLFGRTAFLAEKVLGNVVSSGRSSPRKCSAMSSPRA
jgi:type IV secretory pathway TrbL component